MVKLADKDILEALATIEFAAELDESDTGAKPYAQCATVFRRLAREAGYKIPDAFNWSDHMPEEE